MRGDTVNSIVIQANPEQLRRIEAGDATPEERDAWQEVNTVAFLLGTMWDTDRRRQLNPGGLSNHNQIGAS
jgi:hypothetical protein